MFFLSVGGNYNTRDGTGVRDFIHIEDLIDGHFESKKILENNNGYFVGILAG